MMIKRFVTLMGFIVLLLAAGLLFTPAQWGGQFGFVVVNGNSMAPLYHRGDLVITRVAEAYTVGEIVTYRHPEIGTVIHRLLERKGERWQLQGDNNSSVDPYEPLPAELTGRAWLHVPQAGRLLMQLRSFWYVPALLVAGGMLMKEMRKPEHARHARRQRAFQAQPALDLSLSLLTLMLIGALLASGLAVYAFTLPLSSATSLPLTYSHKGNFIYVAPAPDGIYDAPEARSGDPIFTRLSTLLDLGFTYTFSSELPAEITGTAVMLTELSASNGWRRNLTPTQPQTFSGATTGLSSTIDLAFLRGLIEQFETQTGLRGMQYQLSFTPQITLAGVMSGSAFSSSFSPQLRFRVEDDQIILMQGDAGLAVLTPVLDGSLVDTDMVPSVLNLFGLKHPVLPVRIGGLLVAGLLLGLSALLGWLLLRLWQQDEHTQIRMRYGAQIIDGATPPELGRFIRVADIAHLARLAERHATLIVCDTHAQPQRYLVIDGPTVYVYMVEAPVVKPTSDAAPIANNPPVVVHPLAQPGADLPADALR